MTTKKTDTHTHAKAGHEAAEPEAFVTEDSHKAFEHFAPLAQEIPEAEVELCNGDPAIILTNAQRALDAVLPHLDAVLPSLPVRRHEILEIPTLARALQFAAMQVTPPAASPQEIQAKLQEVRPARRLGLLMLDVLADPQVALVPSGRVQAIHRGTGPSDTARDAVAIRAIFREFEAALKGKHPIPQKVLDKLGDDGEWLISQLTPSGAAPAPSAGPDPRAVLRDRLWTLLHQRHDGPLFLVGAKIWGRRKVDDHIPSLLAHTNAAPAAPAAQDAAATLTK